MKAFSVGDFSVLVGIDWADQKHDVSELVVGSDQPAHLSTISSRPEAIHEWAMSLRMRHDNKPIAVACELKKGPLIYALLKYQFITIFPLHPATVAKMRKAFHPSGAKSDPVDAQLQAELLRDYMHKLTPIVPDSAADRALAQLVECRRKLVQDRVDLTNSLTYYLKNYYPQVLDWFNEKDSHVFCDFVTKWPSLERVQRARKKTLVDFMHQHNVRYADVIEQRLAAIKTAIPLTEDEGVVVPNQLMAELEANQLKVLLQSIERIEQEIKKRYCAMADRKIFDSFPGAGPQFAPRLLVAFGSERSRYENASAMQKYAGIAPVMESSGTRSWTHWRYACPKFLRQTFVEWAGQTVRYSFWARAYYNQQKSKGKAHNTIIRSLAFKWIRIMFRCWKEREPYDESKYLEALKERGSPLLQFAVET
jgi:transposase